MCFNEGVTFYWEKSKAKLTLATEFIFILIVIKKKLVLKEKINQLHNNAIYGAETAGFESRK